MGNWVTISTAGASGYTPPPDAPNITSVTAAATYGMVGNASTYGFSGTINLPTADANYSHLKEIAIEAVFAGGSKKPLMSLYSSSFSGSTISFQTPCDLAQAGTAQNVTITCRVKNDAGIATAPVSASSVTVTVQASAVTGFSSAGETGTRFIVPENNDRLPCLTVDFVPILSGGQVPQTVSFGVSDDNGTSWTPIGWARINTVGQHVTFTRPAMVPGTWKVYAVAGAVDYSPTKITSLPPGAVPSSGFTVAPVPTPAASNGITATVGVFSAIQRRDGTWYGSIPPFTGTDPTGANTDFYFRIVITELDGAHNPIGARKVHDGWQIAGAGVSHTTANPLLITLRDGLGGIRYEVFIANKLSTGGGDFAVTSTNTLQNVAWNGGSPVDHDDVMFGTLPDDAIPPMNLTDDWGSGIYRGADGKPKAAGAGDPLNMFTNGRFEDGRSGWTSFADPWVYSTGGGITGGCAVMYGPNSYITQTFNSRPGTRYFVSTYFTSSHLGTGLKANLTVWWLNAAGSIIDSQYVEDMPVAYVWRQHSMTTNPAPAGTVSAQFFVGGVGIPSGQLMEFDDCCLIEQTSTGAGTTPDGKGGVKLNTTNLANMVMNWSFEDGLAGWLNYNASIQSVGGVTGANRVLIAPGGYVREDTYHTCRTGDVYYVEVWVSSDGGANHSGRIFVEFRDNAGTDLPGTAVSSHGDTGGVFVLLSGNVTIPSGSTSFRIGVDAPGETAYNWYLDNVICKQQVSTGDGTSPDGKGGVQVNLSGPLYVDVSNNVNIRIASDFVVSGGILGQGVVDLAKSVNFNTSEFTGGSGTALRINAIAVNKLIAGDALFAGQATFAYSGGGKVTINSSGITLADSNTSPSATVTIASGGISLVKGSSNVSITAAGVSITNGSFSATSGTASINIDGSNIIRVLDSTSNRLSQMTKDYHRVQLYTDSTRYSQVQLGMVITSQSGGASRAYITESGTLELYGTVGVAGVYINGVKVL